MKKQIKIKKIKILLFIFLLLSIIILTFYIINHEYKKIGNYNPDNVETISIIIVNDTKNILRCIIIPENVKGNVKITFENGSDIPPDNCVDKSSKLNITVIMGIFASNKDLNQYSKEDLNSVKNEK